jgi:hypothetical protein
MAAILDCKIDSERVSSSGWNSDFEHSIGGMKSNASNVDGELNSLRNKHLVREGDGWDEFDVVNEAKELSLA